MKPLVALALAAILCCGFLGTAQQSDGTLIFRNVDVFDGTRTLRGTNVIVRNGMIRGIGSDISIPDSAAIIEGKGKTLLPGLFDAHVHLGVFMAEQFLRDALTFGITTEIEMGGNSATLALRKKMAGGPFEDRADLRTAGLVITVPNGHPTQMGGPPMPTLAPGDDAQAFVDARIAEGSDFIKIIYEHAYPTLTKQQLEDVVTAAHRRNKLVVAHVTRQSDARDAIAAGVDGLAHAFEDSAPDPDFAEFAKQHHVFVIATLATEEGLGGASHWWQNIPHVVANISSTMRGSLELKFPPDADANRKFENAKAVVGALHRAGVPLVAGTDAPFPGVAHGLGLHRELQLLVLSGLSPSEALASATSEPARTFGFYDRGRIAAGMRADLLLVNGDPTVDINATHDIVGVWKLGVQHSRPSASPPAKQP